MKNLSLQGASRVKFKGLAITFLDTLDVFCYECVILKMRMRIFDRYTTVTSQEDAHCAYDVWSHKKNPPGPS